DLGGRIGERRLYPEDAFCSFLHPNSARQAFTGLHEADVLAGVVWKLNDAPKHVLPGSRVQPREFGLVERERSLAAQLQERRAGYGHAIGGERRGGVLAHTRMVSPCSPLPRSRSCLATPLGVVRVIQHSFGNTAPTTGAILNDISG